MEEKEKEKKRMHIYWLPTLSIVLGGLFVVSSAKNPLAQVAVTLPPSLNSSNTIPMTL